MPRFWFFLIWAAGIPVCSLLADAKPVKVFILAGQSNMEGKAPDELFEHQATAEGTKELLAEVKMVMENPGAVFPELEGGTAELAGLVWLQGWNDQYGSENEYASNMRHFIHDVRNDLGAPRLPVVIAAMGQNGSKPAEGAMRIVQDAQLSMNDVPEFIGTVRAIRTDTLVDTAAEELYPRWQEDIDQWKRVGGDHPYHFLGSAVWFTRIGQAMAEAMDSLLSEPVAQDAEEVEAPPNPSRLRVVEDAMATAFGEAADDTALDRAMELLTAAPDDPNARAVVKDLERRRMDGRFGVAPAAKPPEDLDAWIDERRIDALIAGLDDVAVEQDGWPGGVDLAEDWRVDALIRIGDPAVPALIDVIEKDERLTRSIHCWRFRVSCTILSVREAALTAVMSILQVRFFEAGATGDNFTSHGNERAAKIAARIRAYWDRFGKLPFDERLMAIIQDTTITGEPLQEAVKSLAFIDDRVRLGTTVWTESVSSPATPREHPALAKFSAPTAAEAVFAAMQRDFAAFDGADALEDKPDYARRWMERTYASAFLGLGDNRIVTPMLEYARACPPRHRLALAFAAHKLGDSRDAPGAGRPQSHWLGIRESRRRIPD